MPYPPDYGGIIDVYYKVKALFDAGIQVHLHCFEYGRKKNDALKSICASVTYYPRAAMWKGFLSDKPFIVQSRNAPKLLTNLKKNNYPILFEGLHCCYYLTHPALESRAKWVRMHNNEPEYYLHLGKNEKQFFKKVYFFAEYRRLIKYEWVLTYAQKIFCISHPETEFFSKRFDNASYLPAFNGNTVVTSKTGIGQYILYHGNLEVNENVEAALYLIKEVFSKCNFPCVIAGANPSPEIVNAAKMYNHIRIHANPDANEMLQLIQDAHIHYLPAFQSTGIKLKLLNALFNGRFCLVNNNMLNGTGLDEIAIQVNDATTALEKINELMQQPFTQTLIEKRKLVLQPFSDAENVKKIIKHL